MRRKLDVPDMFTDMRLVAVVTVVAVAVVACHMHYYSPILLPLVVLEKARILLRIWQTLPLPLLLLTQKASRRRSRR